MREIVGGLIAAAGTILLAFQSGITFFGDEWTFLLDRRGWSAGDLLDPHNDHIAIALALIYKLLLSAFGMDSALASRSSELSSSCSASPSSSSICNGGSVIGWPSS